MPTDGEVRLGEVIARTGTTSGRRRRGGGRSAASSGLTAKGSAAGAGAWFPGDQAVNVACAQSRTQCLGIVLGGGPRAQAVEGTLVSAEVDAVDDRVDPIQQAIRVRARPGLPSRSPSADSIWSTCSLFTSSLAVIRVGRWRAHDDKVEAVNDLLFPADDDIGGRWRREI